MAKRIIVYVSAYVLFFGLSLPLHAQSAGSQQLTGHVPAVLATAPLVGELSGTEQMHLAIGLPIRNQALLDQYLKDIYDPHSPQYGHYLKKGEFGRMYGPSESDYEAVVQFAKTNNLKVEGTYGSRLMVSVSGASADVAKAFHVKFHYYQRADGTKFRAPENEPSVDLAVPISHISGLDDYVLPRHGAYKNKILPAHANIHSKPGPKANAVLGSGPQGTYLGNDFRAAYAPGVSLTGANQSVGLVEFDGYYPQDIAQYESEAGLSNFTVTPVSVGGYDGNPAENAQDLTAVGEVEMDIEVAGSMAPGANILVYEGEWFVTAPDAVLAQIADEQAANQISCSWVFYNDVVTAEILEQMAAQKQSFFQSSGDGGGVSDPGTGGNMDQVWVTNVGGTVLSMNGNGQSYLSESGWVGSGGFISTDQLISPYQRAVYNGNGASTTNRNIPDVSMVADAVYVITTDWDNNGNPIHGQAIGSGGTSASTPLWAAYLALVNEQRASNGLTPLGFANPALYAVAAGPDYQNAFHDVTTGNSFDGNGGFSAGPGYDLVTGLGSPAGQTLINDLCPSCAPIVLIPTPTVTNTPVFTYTPLATPTSGICLTQDGILSQIFGTATYANPQGMALDANGNVYVADSANFDLERFAPNGNFIKGTFGNGSGSAPGQFLGVVGVAVDPWGNVFASDRTNNRIVKFDSNGNYLTEFGTQGSGLGQLSFPYGIACDSQGRVFVADLNNNRIEVFNNDGSNPVTFGSAGSALGQMNQPEGIALDNNGNIFVSDTGNNRIEKFNSSFTPQIQWGSTAAQPGSQPGQFNIPQLLCFAGKGLIVVADTANKRVQLFDVSGNFLGQIATAGGPFSVAGNGSRLYVSGGTGTGTNTVSIYDIGNCPIAAMTPPLTETPTMTISPTATNTGTPQCPGGGTNGLPPYYSQPANIALGTTAAYRLQFFNPTQIQNVLLLGNETGLPRTLGFYADDGTGSHPTQLLASTTFTDADGHSFQTVPITLSVQTGYVWVAVAANANKFAQPTWPLWNAAPGSTGSAVLLNGQMPATAPAASAYPAGPPPAIQVLYCPIPPTPTNTATSTATAINACPGGSSVGPSLNLNVSNPVESLNNGDTYAVRVVFNQNSVIKAIQVYGLGSGLERSVGVYDDSGNGSPTNLLASNTFVDGSAGGVQEVPFNLEVGSGVKWLAISSAVGPGRPGHPNVFKYYTSPSEVVYEASFQGQMPAAAGNPAVSFVSPVAVSALYCPACTLTGTRWSQAASSYIGGPREFMGTAVYNGLLWTIGGRSPLGDSGDCDFSPDGVNWFSATPFGAIGSREGQVLLAFDPGDGEGERLYAIGGSRYPGNTFTGAPTNTYNDVWSSFDGANWTPVTSNGGFTAGAFYVGTVFNKKMWMIGGGTAPNTNKVWSSSDGKTWTSSFTLEGSQTAQALLVNNGEMVAIENGYRGFPAYGNLIFSSTDGATWNPVTKNPAGAFGNRSGFSAQSAWGKLWIMGGTILGQTAGQDTLMNDVWSSANGTAWTQETGDAEFFPRQNAGSFDFDGQLWVLGGMTNPANTPSNGFGYTGDVWSTYCIEGPVTVRGGIAGGLLGNIVNQIGHLIGLSFNLSNTSTEPLNLSGIEVRYWFNSTCGTPNIRAWVQGREGDTGRRDNGFGGLIQTSVGSLTPGSSIQYISFKFNNANLPVGNQLTIGAFAAFGQNPFANCSLSALPPGNQLTIYEDGTLVQGQEPTGAPATPTFSPTFSATYTPTISPTSSSTPSATFTYTKTVTPSPTVLLATPTPTCPLTFAEVFNCGPTSTPTTQNIVAASVARNAMTPTVTLTLTPTATSTAGIELVLSAVIVPHAVHGGKPVKLQLTLSSPALVQWTITSTSGEKIYQTSVMAQSGLNSLTWSGLNELNMPVGDGVYTYVIEAQEGLNQTVTQGRIFVRH